MRRKHTFKPSTLLVLAVCVLFTGRGFSQVVINEIDSDTPGTDNLEFIELYDGGSGGAPLDGLVLVFFNGNGDVSYQSLDLDGLATDASGYFVIGNPDVTQAGLNFPAGGLQNGSDAVALYQADALDFPDGTALAADNLIDAVVYGTDDLEDEGLLALLNAGQRQVDEQGRGDKDAHSLQRFPNGSGGSRNTSTFAPREPTPGRSNGGETASLEIHDVQGNGMISPCVDQNVLLSQNIVTGAATDGYFIQTPDARQDDDPETSQGIFVYSDNAPTVHTGDLVDVEGLVQEFYGATEIHASGDAVVLSSNHPLPAPVLFDATLPSPDPDREETALERFEGMRVRIVDGVVCGPTDSRGEAWLTATDDRTFREPGILFPGRSGLPVWDGNPEKFILDPNGFDLNVPQLCAGARIDSLIGVLTYRFGGYQIRPSVLSVSENECLSSVRPRDDDEFTIATLNLHRLMDDADDPLTEDEVLATDVYQRQLKKLSLYIREALNSPDILAVQEAENQAVLEALAEQIQTDDPDMQYSSFLREGNDVSGIDVGFLVTETIVVDSVIQIGKEAAFEFEGVPFTLHDRPPLVLYFRTGTGEAFRGVVMNLHLRSMIGMDEVDSLRIREKRRAQAVDVAQRIQTLQENDPAIRLAVTGDFNAFQFTDGFVDVLGQITGSPDPAGALVPCTPLVDPPLFNQILSLDDEDRYSYVFEGSAQTLDHILISETLNEDVMDIQFGRGNADAPVSFEEDADSPLVASDHDGLAMFVLSRIQDGVSLEETSLPSECILHGNYPNPFNPSTRIDFVVPRDGKADLSVYNVLGERVITLHSGFLEAGHHSFFWEGKDKSGREVSGGVYLLHLRTDRGIRIRKMVLQR